MSHSPETDSNKTLLSEEESTAWGSDEKLNKKRFSVWWKVMLYPILISIIFAFGGIVGYNWSNTSDWDDICSHHVAQYCEPGLLPSEKYTYLPVTAPLFKDVDVKYNVTQFDGTFIHENIYRQNASPEVDAAWEALGTDCIY